jgi:hypothetical protein
MGLYGLWKALRMYRALWGWKMEWADIDAQWEEIFARWRHIDAVEEKILRAGRAAKDLAIKLEVTEKLLRVCEGNGVPGKKCF